MTIEQAIEQSQQENRTVTLSEYDLAMVEDLVCASDDNVLNGGDWEFWGTDDDGNTWRVHLADARETYIQWRNDPATGQHWRFA